MTTKEIQLLLISAGFNIKADGISGPKTLLAIKSFQEMQNLPITGVADQVTIDKLIKFNQDISKPTKMANISLLVPKIIKWEGGYVNDPLDNGGATNMGVTISTWKQVGYDKDGDGDIDVQDLKKMDKKDFERVLRIYWNRWKADEIKDQKVAEILVDWVWGSGSWGIKKPQELLGLVPDGIVGQKTINTINEQDPKVLHEKLFNLRLKFLNDIVKNNPSQKRFIKGWVNRLNDFK